MNVNYLNRRQLSPVLPDGYGAGDLSALVSPFCNDNTGTNGGFKVYNIESPSDASVYIELRQTNETGALLDSATVDLSVASEHTFNALADGTYWLSVEGVQTGYIFKFPSKVLACSGGVTQPVENTNDILCELIHFDPVYEAYDVNSPELGGEYVYKTRAWKFSTTSETVYMITGTKRVATGATAPADFLAANPIHGYCVPNTTTRKEFYYASEGVISLQQDTQSVACGFVKVFGCTDATANNYNASATHDDGSCRYRPQVFGCTDPTATNYNPNATDNDGSCVFATPVLEPVFSVSLMNSLRFVVQNSDTVKTLDNTLFCEQGDRNMRNPGYYQKVTTQDELVLQIRSNYDVNTLHVREHLSGASVKTVAGAVKVSNTGLSEAYSGYLRNNGNKQTRVYFNSGDIPQPAEIGDVIVLSNTVNMNGEYAIVSVNTDPKLNSMYLVINKVFSGTESQSATVEFKMAMADYNVVEFTLNWSDVAAGKYYCTIESTDATFGAATMTSEPVDLAAVHAGTYIVEYRNSDNGFDVVYSTGIKHRIRVDGELYRVMPSGEREVYTQPGGVTHKLSATVYRGVEFRTFNLPWYLHEKLAYAFEHDYVTVNNVPFQSKEGYNNPEYTELHMLSDSTVLLTQTQLFKQHNGHNLPNVDGEGLLLGNSGGFIKL